MTVNVEVDDVYSHCRYMLNLEIHKLPCCNYVAAN